MMKAKIVKPAQNARNYGGEKEQVSTWTVTAVRAGNIEYPVSARCWMGRSRNASTVYASIWVHGRGVETAGSGNAGGWGYHKESAAIGEAIKSAGIELYGSPYAPRRDEPTDFTKRAYRRLRRFEHPLRAGGHRPGARLSQVRCGEPLMAAASSPTENRSTRTMQPDWNECGPRLLDMLRQIAAGRDPRPAAEQAIAYAERSGDAEAWRAFYTTRWGERWAVCRDTNGNRSLWGRCISQSEYDQARADYLAGRAP